LIAGKYRIHRLLGEGAMGVVWAAVNERTEREVALKLINGENDALRRRLLREARACGRVVHRNIIEILDVGETETGDPFLIMPLLSGETLADRLKRDGLLPPPLAARIAADIARGLDAAHAAGIVHRDLKPANVFFHHEPGSDEDFVIKVLDFGVSKMLAPGDAAIATMSSAAVGSPLYMSPEQAIGDAGVGPRADLWALGVLLFEMLTGTRPFYASTAFAVVAKILRGPIPTVVERAPGVDPALGAVVARCLVRRPAQRIASAAELCALLEPFAGAREHPAPLPPLPPPPDDDEEEETNFFRRSRNASADEVMAAAQMLTTPEVLSSAEILSSSEVITSADIITTGPAEEPTPQAIPGPLPPPSDPESSTVPLVQPSDRAPDDGAGVYVEARSRRPRRTGLWLVLVGVSALVVALGLYLISASAPSASAKRAAAAPDPPPAPLASAQSAAPAGSASTAASAAVEPSPPAPAPSPSGALPKSAAHGRTQLAPATKTRGKIIRETPF
jgi:serine/threonine-protein kinase